MPQWCMEFRGIYDEAIVSFSVRDVALLVQCVLLLFVIFRPTENSRIWRAP